MKPAISVCIPIYNVEKYIENCIQSVLSQSFQDFEIVIVNDASPDKSMDIVNALAHKDKRIHVYENAKNMGLMWTRREGYIKAKGDYVVFLDSDDTLPSDALENLYAAIYNSEYDIVCGQIAYITSEGISLEKYPNKLLYGADSSSAMLSTLKWEITHNLCGKIYKRELLQNYNYETFEDVVNAEDAILFYQLLVNMNKIKTINQITYNYYLYDSSSTNIILGEKALNGIFLWQKIRYNILNEKYPCLLDELKTSMTMYLASLAPSLDNNKQINKYLTDFEIPFRMCFANIYRFVPRKHMLKCALCYYLSGIVQKIRFFRLKNSDK